MAAYVIEIIKQCFERAIEAHTTNVTSEESRVISDKIQLLLILHGQYPTPSIA